ncbi:MAG TPA: SDR family NAD(P)-dependent oxidoreductase, partial [Terracidiphilus sp.]
MPRLKGQVAFVTGAGRGIGQAMALAFAQEGAIIGVADIDPATAKSTVSQIEKSAGTARAFAIDVSNRDDVLRAVAALVSEFGRLDIIANNAIVFCNEPVSDVRPETIERMFS